MQEQVDRTTAVQRIAVMMLGVFGGLALLLATIGLYGVLSYTVSQRTRELGLRMALGAGTSNVLGLVMSHGLALTAGGVVLGTAAALSLTRLMGNLLYKVSPRDPLAFGSAFVVMAIAALAACFLPAWRAARTDPVRALRHQVLSRLTCPRTKPTACLCMAAQTSYPPAWANIRSIQRSTIGPAFDGNRCAPSSM